MDTGDESLVPQQSSGVAKVRGTEKKPDVRPDTSINFEFLTFTDLEQTLDPKMKRKVRSHAMHRVHRTTRIGERSRNKDVIVLDTSSLFKAPSRTDQQVLAAPLGTSNVGAGRSNPFAKYPIPMSMRTQHLFDHLRGDFCPMFRTMSKFGFFQSMTDPAGFRQILCTSASHMEVLRGKPATEAETSEALSFSTEAIRSVNTRLVDPVENTSDGIFGAILAFCCHSIMFQDLKNSITHLKGLEEIVRRRGGLESFEKNPVLRIMLFWADTNIAFAEDVSPHFPAPIHLFPSVDQRPIQSTVMKLTEACTHEDLASAMVHLYKFNQLLIDEASTRDIWTDGVFAELNLMPVLHKLLSIRFELCSEDPVVRTQEAYRLGAINYLAAIRDKFAVNLSALGPLRKLKDTVCFLERSVADFDLPLLLWLLVVGGTQSIRKGERHRDRQVHEFFITKLAELIRLMGCASWEEIMYHIKGILWIEGLAQRECEVLNREISTKVWN